LHYVKNLIWSIDQKAKAQMVLIVVFIIVLDRKLLENAFKKMLNPFLNVRPPPPPQKKKASEVGNCRLFSNTKCVSMSCVKSIENKFHFKLVMKVWHDGNFVFSCTAENLHVSV
jgi:hypothetical protein